MIPKPFDVVLSVVVFAVSEIHLELLADHDSALLCSWFLAVCPRHRIEHQGAGIDKIDPRRG
jgi:hypothetical protein